MTVRFSRFACFRGVGRRRSVARFRGLAGCLFGLSCAWACGAGTSLAAPPTLTPVVADVLTSPQAVAGSDGKRHLVYELRLANATPAAVDLERIEVIEPATGKTVLALDRNAIAERVSLGGRRGAEAARIGTGQFAVAFLHVPLGGDESVPKALVHRIKGTMAGAGVDFTESVGETEVVDRPPLVLAPPFMGRGFLAGDGCCNSIRHVRALLPIDGRLVLAQRYAIDWEQADESNRLVVGDTKVLESYVIFGQAVLAGADGTVASSRNDLAEQVPGALPASLPLEEADGNFVVLDVGGRFVLYAHMQPGSVTVKAGDRVKRGDVLGKVGNTGNSQAPHLHMHVTDGPSPMTSTGVPYVFDAFVLTASDTAGTADFDRAEATGSPLTLAPVSPPEPRRMELPLDLSVVEFAR